VITLVVAVLGLLASVVACALVSAAIKATPVCLDWPPLN